MDTQKFKQTMSSIADHALMRQMDRIEGSPTHKIAPCEMVLSTNPVTDDMLVDVNRKLAILVAQQQELIQLQRRTILRRALDSLLGRSDE